jgi:hypothetical protein
VHRVPLPPVRGWVGLRAIVEPEGLNRQNSPWLYQELNPWPCGL